MVPETGAIDHIRRAGAPADFGLQAPVASLDNLAHARPAWRDAIIKGEQLFWFALGIGGGTFIGAAFSDWALGRLADAGAHVDIIAAGVGGFGGAVVTIGGAALIEERKAARRATPHGIQIVDIAAEVRSFLLTLRSEARIYIDDSEMVPEIGATLFAEAFDEIASATRAEELIAKVRGALGAHGIDVPEAVNPLLGLRDALEALHTRIRITRVIIRNASRRGHFNQVWSATWFQFSGAVDSAIEASGALLRALARYR